MAWPIALLEEETERKAIPSDGGTLVIGLGAKQCSFSLPGGFWLPGLS